MFIFRLMIAVLAIFIISAQFKLHADILQYEFSGTIPVGIGSNYEGRTFTATFEIDMSVSDSEPGNPNLGIYLKAATIGTIKFSGGFADVGGPMDVYVYDNYGTPGSDLVAINGYISNNPLIVTASNFSNLSTLESDALPGHGTYFESAPDPAPISRIVLSYATQGIYYSSDDAHNVSFSAENIPEPSTSMFIGIFLLWMGIRRRRARP